MSYSAPVALQRRTELGIAGFGRQWSCHHDHVDGWQITRILAERLADHALYAIALYRRRRRLARNRKTEARIFLIVHGRQHGKVFIGAADGIGEDPFVLFGGEQTPLPRKT